MPATGSSNLIPGPVFLYLHGFGSSVHSTKAKAFTAWAQRQGIALDVLDLRVPSFEHLLLSAMKERVIAAIDAAGRDRSRAVLIGSSLGGITACRVAEADPRVAAVFLMAPAFQIASRWQARIGTSAWESWKRTGFLEVDDHGSTTTRTTIEGTNKKTTGRVHFGFVEELARIDAELGPWPDVRVPVRIVHGTRDDVVDIELSRQWAAGKRHVHLVEVDDTHELGTSIPQVLDEAADFLKPFLGPQKST
jgi:pimeloyl-ACP methyl ester carboxylesterase